MTALARDRTSGATALARRAAHWLGRAARDDGKPLARWQQELRAAGLTIAAAQPAMASILSVVDRAFRVAEAAATPASGARAVRRALDRYLAGRRAALTRAAARAAARLPARAVCLTLSSSEVVFHTLLAARARGRLARVIVAESRPGREGVGLARRLGRRGVPTAIIVDALVAALAPEVDVVLVGADAVTPREVWNKCGTLAAALGARAAGRPLVVVTTDDRLVPTALARRLRVPDVEPSGVLPKPPRGVRAVNRLFDRTPLGLVDRVVSERGTFTARALRARLRGRGVAGWWK